MKETELNGGIYGLSIHYAAIDTRDVLNIYEYLMQKHELQSYLGLSNLYLLQ